MKSQTLWLVSTLGAPVLLRGGTSDDQGGSVGCVTALLLFLIIFLSSDWAFGKNRVFGVFAALWRRINPNRKVIEPLPPLPKYPPKKPPTEKVTIQASEKTDGISKATPPPAKRIKTQELFPSVLRLLGTILLITLGIFVIVGLVCWFGGWRSAYEYGNGLVYTGVVVIAIGLYGLQGGWRGERSYAYTQGRSVGQGDIGTRTRHVRHSTTESYAFTIKMGAAGLLAIALGILIQSIVS